MHRRHRNAITVWNLGSSYATPLIRALSLGTRTLALLSVGEDSTPSLQHFRYSWTISENGSTSRTRWISAGRWKNFSRNISVHTGLDLVEARVERSRCGSKNARIHH